MTARHDGTARHGTARHGTGSYSFRCVEIWAIWNLKAEPRLLKYSTTVRLEPATFAHRARFLPLYHGCLRMHNYRCFNIFSRLQMHDFFIVDTLKFEKFEIFEIKYSAIRRLEPATFCMVGGRSTDWATRAVCYWNLFLIIIINENALKTLTTK